MSKNSPGNFFEDFRVGQVIRHATPRTLTAGDVALYNALFGARFAVQSSDAFAKAIGYPRAPVVDYVRWVMVRKRDEAAPAPGDHVPRLPTALYPKLLGEACPEINIASYDLTLAGSPH